MDPKKIKEQIAAAEQLGKNMEGFANILREKLETAVDPDKVEKTRCVTGSMISVMGDGSVRIKFDSDEKREEFYMDYK